MKASATGSHVPLCISSIFPVEYVPFGRGSFSIVVVGWPPPRGLRRLLLQSSILMCDVYLFEVTVDFGLKDTAPPNTNISNRRIRKEDDALVIAFIIWNYDIREEVDWAINSFVRN